MLWIAAIGACLGAIILWQLTMIASLRIFDVKIPFSIAFHIYPRRQHELFDALKKKRKDTFVLISGFLLFACPLFVGLTAYDYVIDRSNGYITSGLNHFVGSAVVLMVMIGCGIWTSVSNWNKSSDPSSPRP